jgi:hypothetical protein
MMDDINTDPTEQMKKMQSDYLNTSSDYAHAFDSDTGRAVIKDLKAMTEISVLSGNNMMTASVNVSPAEFVFIREGQNQVVKYIEQLIKFYGENK